jgi:TPR repeat protein
MKKLVTICLFMAITFTVNAQTLRGSCYEKGQGTSSYFTQVDMDATFSFYAKNNSVYIKCSSLKMNVPSNTTYNAYGQTYTKSDLDISQWPQNQKPWSMTINVSGSYNGGNFNKNIFCKVNFTCDEFSIEGIDADKVNLSSFRINSISNFTYNQGGDSQLEEIIRQKNKQKSQTANSSNISSQNSGSRNLLTTNQSTTTTNEETPNYNLKDSDFGIPENTPTYTKQELRNLVATQAAGLVGESLNDWADNIEKKRDAKEDEKERIIKSQKDYFENTYLNSLINKANNGDEIARMTLCFASKYILDTSTDKSDKWDEWLATAAKNNNFDAMLEMANITIFKNRQDAIKILEEAANLGSVDAMVKLADWYDNKTLRCGGGPFVGGENPEKAFEWFEKAALRGSPVAMYRLGMIYKYSSTHDKDKYNYCANSKKVHVKYNVVKDELKAFEWFSKSINPNYKESLFSTSKNNDTNFGGWGLVFENAKASFFHPNSFLELAIFYSSSTVIPKDNEMAKKLKMYYKGYVNINKF